MVILKKKLFNEEKVVETHVEDVLIFKKNQKI